MGLERVIATRRVFLHYTKIVTWSGSKSVAVILLFTAVLWNSQMVLPSYDAASAIPAGCHNHGRPDRTPISHQCCAAGHSPSSLPTNTFAQSLHEFPSYVVTEPDEGNRSQEPLFSPSLSSGSLPNRTPLRI
jgi:hypothetical protein